MTLDQCLSQLAKQQYPQQVNVVDKVMAQVSATPYMQLRHTKHLWSRAAIVAAAAVAALVIVNVAVVRNHNYDEESMGNMIASLNDYSSWNTIEDAAVNPIEYLYDE